MPLLEGHIVRYSFQFALKESLNELSFLGTVSRLPPLSIINPPDDFSTSLLFKITFPR
jgi:hypothetical protein